MARPSVIDEPLIEAVKNSGRRGARLIDIEDEVLGTGRSRIGTKRGLLAAARRAVQRGQLARVFEYYKPDTAPAMVRVHRYWWPPALPPDKASFAEVGGDDGQT